MINALHLMNAGGLLPPTLERDLRKVARVALSEQAARLDLSGVDLAIYVSPWTLPETGVGGYAPLPHWVQVTVTPTNPHFQTTWLVEVPATIAHELHHARRWRGPGYGNTLLEVLVTEGLAQHFEEEVRGGPPPYSAICADLGALWRRAHDELDAQGYDHNAWFFGFSQKGLPRWAGYALGYELIKRYFESHGGSAAEDVDLPAEQVRQVWTI